MARYDYTTVGHVTADVLGDGSRRPGGGAFYSALQAARLGRRTLIVTQGVRSEIEQLLEPYRGELDVEMRAAAQTTTLQTVRQGAAQMQRVLAWARPIEQPLAVDTDVLHFAPVAQETPRRWSGRAEFIGVTAQGLVRAWSAPGNEIEHVPLAPERLPRRWDAIVISHAERDSCAWLIGAVDASPRDGTQGALVAVTAEGDATALHVPGSAPLAIEVRRVERFADDIGAGDVFAAAFFIALRDGRDPPEAAAFGNAAAAVRIARAGPGGVGDRAAIEERLQTCA